MKSKPKKSPARKIIVFLAALFLSFGAVYFYFQIWKKPIEVDARIARHHLSFTGHAERLWEAAFSPDGELVVSGSVDGVVKIWRKSDGRVVHTIEHPAGITGVKFSPDGETLATSSYDSVVRLWRAAGEDGGAPIRTFSGHEKTVWDIAFSPDGKMLASAGEDAKIRLWDVERGTLLKTIEAHEYNIWSIAFSPDGSKLASGSFDRKVKIWNVDGGGGGQLIKTIEGHTQAVLSVAFSRDGRYLASGGDDSTANVWDTENWGLIRSFQRDSEHIYSVAFSPDSRRLLTAGRDRNIFGELLQNFFGTSDSDKWVTARLWNVEDGRLIQTFAHHSNDVFTAAFSPDGGWIAQASEDKTVSVWQVSK